MDGILSSRDSVETNGSRAPVSFDPAGSGVSAKFAFRVHSRNSIAATKLGFSDRHFPISSAVRPCPHRPLLFSRRFLKRARFDRQALELEKHRLPHGRYKSRPHTGRVHKLAAFVV